MSFGSGRSTTRGQKDFARVPSVSVPRSVFNRSCGLKTTFNPGILYPVFVDHALPGDTFSMNPTAVVRLTTQKKPIYDNLSLDMHFFAIPYRLLGENWQELCGEESNPGQITERLVPTVTVPSGGYDEDSIFDYMGIPPGVEFRDPATTGDQDERPTAYPLRAYNLTHVEWFRDENLVDKAPINVDDGPDDHTDYTLLRRGKRHDYFTSCLPWPQKGTAVSLPLGTTAPVLSSGDGIPTFDVGGASSGLGQDSHDHGLGGGPTPYIGTYFPGTNNIDSTIGWDDPKLEVDLSTATAATINELRQAFQIQRMYERDARGGTRYTELLRSHFGVISPDQRLQRPEFLSGTTFSIVQHQVPSTLDSSLVSPPRSLGDLAAYGQGVSNGGGFVKSFVEHCVVLGFISARADLNYQQGLERHWSKRTRFDFYWPSLAHLGEQAVRNIEIYAQGTADDEAVFGYQERYAEYRYKPSLVTASMRSNHSLSVDVYHLAQDFENLPVLNESFIEEDPPIDRVLTVATDTADAFYGDFYFDFKCVRPMPTYGVPGLIDHF